MQYYEIVRAAERVNNYIDEWIKTKLNRSILNEFTQTNNIMDYETLIDNYCLHLNEGNNYLLQIAQINEISDDDFDELMDFIKDHYETASNKLFTKIKKHSTFSIYNTISNDVVQLINANAKKVKNWYNKSYDELIEELISINDLANIINKYSLELTEEELLTIIKKLSNMNRSSLAVTLDQYVKTFTENMQLDINNFTKCKDINIGKKVKINFTPREVASRQGPIVIVRVFKDNGDYNDTVLIGTKGQYHSSIINNPRYAKYFDNCTDEDGNEWIAWAYYLGNYKAFVDNKYDYFKLDEVIYALKEHKLINEIYVVPKSIPGFTKRLARKKNLL